MSRNDSAPVDELDLLAYADGRLDRDPARRQAVEAHLRANPDDAARIDAYVAQNNAIRAAYADVAEEAVPERLFEALERRARPRAGPALRATAAAAALAVAAGAGWWAGQLQREPSLLAESFVEQTMYSHVARPPAQVASDPAGAPGPAQPLVWLSQRISLELQPPDLSAFGFRQVDIRMVEGQGPNAVRVTYADAANRTIDLFLKTRWEETAPALHFVEQDGVSMAYWLDGPLVYGLAARVGQETLAEIAGHIRQVNRTNGAGLNQAGPESPVIRHEGALPATGGTPEGEAQDLAAPASPQAGGGFDVQVPSQPPPAPGRPE